VELGPNEVYYRLRMLLAILLFLKNAEIVCSVDNSPPSSTFVILTSML